MSVDVIMPNRNQARFVETAIRSVIDDPAVANVIIYDDASTDASREVVRSIQSNKIRLICGQASVGASRGRAEAVKAGNSEFLYLLDSDDFLDPRTVSACLEAARAGGYDLCLPSAFLTDEEGSNRRPFLHLDHAVSGTEAALMTLGGWRIFTQGLLRREVYEAAVKNFQPYGYSDDELLSRHIFLECTRVGPGSGGYNYRVIPKEPTAARHLQFALTAATALTLIASRLPEDRGQIASHFSPTVRGLLHCWAAEGSPTMAALKPVTRELIALARHNGWGTRFDRLALRLMIGGHSATKPLVRTMLSARLRLIGAGREGEA